MAPVLLVFCAAVILYDLRERRVPNSVVLAGTILGLAVQSLRGWGGLKSSALGLLLGLALLFPFFAAGMVGGGDVKALGAIGAITGPRVLWLSFMAGAAAGGLVAAFALLHRLTGHRKRDHGFIVDFRCSRRTDGSALCRDRGGGDLPYGHEIDVHINVEPGRIAAPDEGRAKSRKVQCLLPRSHHRKRRVHLRGIPYAAVMAICSIVVQVFLMFEASFR